MQLGMFRPARARKLRSRVRVVGRRLHVGFRTLRCSPSRGIALRIAQLHATASPVRFRTVAVASACRNGSQQCWRVREKRERAGQENESQEMESAERTPQRGGFADEPAHFVILRRTWEKTDSSASSKILLPGSWNLVQKQHPGVRERGGSRFRLERVPI